MDQQIRDSLTSKLEKVVEIVREDLASIRTSRAKPDLLSGIDVIAYGGQKMKLFELATITAPDNNMLIISPWDKGVIQDIEKAITVSNLQLNPTVSGDSIRVVIPALTEERRRDFVKLLHQKLEAGRVMLRQVRQDVKEEVEASEKKDGVSEDDVERVLELMEKTVHDYGTKLDEMGRVKESEIMQV